MSSVRDFVIDEINKACRPETPDLSDPDKPLLSVGLDSLDLASVFMALEDRFGIAIDDDDLERLGTLNNLVRYIEERVR